MLQQNCYMEDGTKSIAKLFKATGNRCSCLILDKIMSSCDITEQGNEFTHIWPWTCSEECRKNIVERRHTSVFEALGEFRYLGPLGHRGTDPVGPLARTVIADVCIGCHAAVEGTECGQAEVTSGGGSTSTVSCLDERFSRCITAGSGLHLAVEITSLIHIDSQLLFNMFWFEAVDSVQM